MGPKAGSERLFTIGDYPLFAFSVAKKEWAELRRRVQLGEDPLEDIQTAQRAPTVKTLGERYVEEHALPNKRTGERDRRRIEKYINPAIGAMKVAAVKYDDCHALHRSLAEKPTEANRIRSLLVTIFDYSIRWGWREDNPARLVKPNREYPRDRFLSEVEIVRLGEVLNDWPDKTSAACIKFLMLTGARRGEALGATWDQFEDGIWSKPASSTKQRKAHRVPLSAPASQIIAEQPRTSDHVFPGKHGGPCNAKNEWIKIRAKAGLEDVRLHDLRHTHASILVSKGHSLEIIGALLGHTQPSTTKRYSHLYDEPLRAAAEVVGEVVAGAGKPKAEVVPMKRGA
jgi:integrase